MANHVYCTYFDHNYLSRGVAMHRSLRRHAPDSRLWVLCLSDACYRTLAALDLPDLVPVRLTEFEAADPEIAATRPHRSTIEYYFTLSAGWMLFVMAREPAAQWVTYLDGDLFFYRSPAIIYDELHNASVAIIPHRYTSRLRKLQKFGTYNVGWVGARNDADGIAVIKWWRSSCIEWCHDHVDGERFADQGYLDGFASRSARVRIIENIGANLAPWNIGNYRIEFRDGGVLIDGAHPLIFFHFQGLRKGLRWFIFSSHRLYRAPFSRVVRSHIYKPYIDELLAVERAVEPHPGAVQAKPHRRSTPGGITQYLRGKLRNLRNLAFQLLDIVTNRAFLVFRGTAY
ncbi:MAG TPA: hypothetical protein VFQ87_20205 [Bradyrhizobium sp.]|nr:hypothetical protein [Bradyrhizobium sp.]